MSAYQAKDRLLNIIQKYIDQNEFGNVAEQQNAIHARDVHAHVRSLNRVQARKLEKAVNAKEGSGVTVSPADYIYRVWVR